MKTIKDWPADDRPREKLLGLGSQALSNTELLTIILGNGMVGKSAFMIAQELLLTFDSDLSKLAALSPDELTQFEGIGKAKAVKLCATFELARRRPKEEQDKATIRSSKDAHELVRSRYLDKLHEEFHVIYLNRANKVLSVEEISKGGLSGTVADGKVIFKKALNKQASGIILSHNHPSGNLTPSAADKKLTNSLKEFGEMIDLQILDHLIVAQDKYFSFADEGLLT